MLPDRARVVVRHILEAQAEANGGRECVRFEDGPAWTYEQSLAEAYRAANWLRDLGVGRGDMVLVLLPNGEDMVRTWWGISALGAVMVPVNTGFRGEMLRHVCADSGAVLAVTNADARDRFADAAPGLRLVDPAGAASAPAHEPGLDAPIEPWDTGYLMYTSGTTGPSKGVVTPYYETYMNARLWADYSTTDDRFLVDLPLYHIGGTSPATGMWSIGAGVAVAPAFSATRYLDRLRALGATQSILIGQMATLLLALPPRDDDAATPLRSVMVAPVPVDQDAFMARFGLTEMWNAFGMTEISPPIMSDRGGQVAKGIGRRRPGYDVRLVDEHDIPVPVGKVGELIVRHDEPWALNAGYHGQPEATARAWRNGWFHTGDAFVEDEDGVFTYVDRMKDAVRRRGQNISSFEVEREVAGHPGVREVACVGVPVAPGDEEVRVFVVPATDAFDPADLIEFLVPRMAPFMVPRYVEVVDELPKSANMRVKKAELRQVPVSAATWDSAALAYKSNGR